MYGIVNKKRIIEKWNMFSEYQKIQTQHFFSSYDLHLMLLNTNGAQTDTREKEYLNQSSSHTQRRTCHMCTSIQDVISD